MHIVDNGIGISPKDQATLFKPDFPDQKRGLLIACDLAEILGGYLKVKSKVNIGSHFTLEFTANSVNPIQESGQSAES